MADFEKLAEPAVQKILGSPVTEIEQLKRTIKNLAEPKNSLINNPFDDLPRITLPSNCSLNFRKIIKEIIDQTVLGLDEVLDSAL